MKHKFLYCLILILFLFTCIACESENFEYSTNFHTEIITKLKKLAFRFEKLKKGDIDFNLEQIIKKLEGDKPNFKAIASVWKGKTTQFEAEFDFLKEDLEELERISKLYFKRLQAVSDSIKEPQLQKMEKEANKRHQAEWEKNHKAIKKNIKLIDDIWDVRHDVFKVMLNAAMRQKRKESIYVLKTISKQLDTYFKDLDSNLKKLITLISV